MRDGGDAESGAGKREHPADERRATEELPGDDVPASNGMTEQQPERPRFALADDGAVGGDERDRRDVVRHRQREVAHPADRLFEERAGDTQVARDRDDQQQGRRTPE